MNKCVNSQLYLKMKKLLLIFLFFTLSHAAWAKKYDPPKLPATEAIQAAKKYVAENNIAISDTSFITEIIYMNTYNEYKPAYWSVEWHVIPRMKGGWIEIRIYNDGKIEPRYGE